MMHGMILKTMRMNGTIIDSQKIVLSHKYICEEKRKECVFYGI